MALRSGDGVVRVALRVGAVVVLVATVLACAPSRSSTRRLEAGAASRSILPTVGGRRDFLRTVPGWPTAQRVDPDDPGVFVPRWDQGQVDVGNGFPDSAWVHDDLRATAVALQRGDERAVLIATDTYMHFAPDVDEIVRRVHAELPKGWSTAPVLVSATHLHEGPDTAFSVNDAWYSLLADQAAAAARQAVERLVPVSATVAESQHGYGVADVRDPLVMDRRLNVLLLDAVDGPRRRVATVVQWNSHPETTLNWVPPLAPDQLAAACRTKGWTGDDCTAEGRYFTADYPGVLRSRIRSWSGGEVLYLNGPLGSQIGPGQAPTWVVDAAHPVTPDGSAPSGAQPLTTCTDEEPLLCRSFAKTESVGDQLARKVRSMARSAQPADVTSLTVRTIPFFTRITNIGFRVLLADRTLGWQQPDLFTCDGHPSATTCRPAPAATTDDPVLTPLTGSKVVVGDVLRSRVSQLDLGSVEFVYLPGELPPELVTGLPSDFTRRTSAYYQEPALHAVGSAYKVPGHLLALTRHATTFTVGLGGDELGYYVPVPDYRLKCLDVALPAGTTCADLAARDHLPDPGYVDGRTCSDLLDVPGAGARLGQDEAAVRSVCRYGQALGRELGEPPGHYEETNSAGWDMVEDLWAALRLLYRGR